MHSIRYERSNHPLVTGNLQALMRKELYAEAQESDVVLNLVQGWSNNFYHALIEIGGRASMFIKYVMLARLNKDISTRHVLLVSNRTQVINRVLSLFQPSFRASNLTKIVQYVPTATSHYLVNNLVWADWENIVTLDWRREEIAMESSIGQTTINARRPRTSSVAMFPSDRFVPSSLAIRLLRNQILHARSKNMQSLDTKIILLVSRRGSKRGEIIGEEMLFHGLVDTFITRITSEVEFETVSQMTSYGVEMFTGHEMTLRDQSKSFYNAVGIVGAHGAGLSNIVFSRPGTVVVEIPLNPFEEGLYFERISRMFSLCYIDTGSTTSNTSISFRYVDNVLIMNERKILKVARMVKQGVDAIQSGKECPFDEILRNGRYTYDL